MIFFKVVRKAETDKQPRRTHFEVKACHNGEPLHCQLLGGLLVTMATAAFDFGTAPQVLGSCESAAQVYMPEYLPGVELRHD